MTLRFINEQGQELDRVVFIRTAGISAQTNWTAAREGTDGRQATRNTLSKARPRSTVPSR
jgi:hypothetical protein